MTESDRLDRTMQELRAVLEKWRPPKATWVYYVVQQGGSSTELYISEFDTLAAAKRFRKDCAVAAYETSKPVRVPRALAAQQGFDTFLYNLIEAIADMRG